MSRRFTSRTPPTTNSRIAATKRPTAASSRSRRRKDNTDGNKKYNDYAKEQEGRFSYSEIHDYLASQKYPLGFTKAEKLRTEKKSEVFQDQ